MHLRQRAAVSAGTGRGRFRRAAGFTLLEIIIVITLTGIVAALATRSISRPVESFVDMSLRAALVDTAELALQRMSREIRLALPNSLRITADGTPLQTCSASNGGICAVEILRTFDGGRYREHADPAAAPGPCEALGFPDAVLHFTAATGCFEVLGPLDEAPDAGTHRLVIFNTGQDGADAWAGDNMADIDDAGTDFVAFAFADSGAHFPFRSPRQRFHIVDTPVSFVCHTGRGTLSRHDGYAVSALQTVNPAGDGAPILANRVSFCSFTYDQGTGTRNALLTATLTIRGTDSQGVPNEIRLVQQVSVPNVP
jgi:MSHA biogenesis protein MshO